MLSFRRSKSALLATALCGSMVLVPFARLQSDAPDPLSNDSLKTMLDNMGYAPSALSKGYLVAIKRDTWTYNMQLVLSDDQTKLGINANLGKVDDPDSVAAATWLKLLQDNADTDPSHFYFDKDQKKLYLHRVLDNRSITPAFLRQQIDAFCGNIHDTSADWAFTK
jgi:hypothetical protein